MKQNTALKNVLADAFADQFDGGTLKIYDGSQPASANDAPSGTLLATINLPTPAFGAAAAGVVAKNGTWSATAVDDGTAGWARLSNAGGTVNIDISVGEGSGELSLDDADIVTGGVVVVSTFTYTQPES